MAYRAFFAGILGALLVPAVAQARDPAPLPAPLSAPLPPSQPPVPPPLAPVIAGDYSCFVGEHAGIDDADARTTTDLVCGELVLVNAPTGAYDVRFGKLGTRVLLGVRARERGEDRRILIQSFDEVPVAARRLVAALVAHKSFEQTADVDNVVAAESPLPKTTKVPTTVFVGLVGMTAAGAAAGVSAGVDVDLMFRVGRLSIGGELRGGGIGSSENKLAFAGADAALRYSLSDADIAPFVGIGLGLSYARANQAQRTTAEGEVYDNTPEGSGFGAHLEGGLELLRRSRGGALVALRVDAPFYVLKGEAAVRGNYDSRSPMYSHGATLRSSKYVVPIALAVGFTFH